MHGICMVFGYLIEDILVFLLLISEIIAGCHGGDHCCQNQNRKEFQRNNIRTVADSREHDAGAASRIHGHGKIHPHISREIRKQQHKPCTGEFQPECNDEEQAESSE